ncbi:MAG: Asp-tRNA(Asn)/Glu-tRNA(Gln) amidotransferase subunit GatC [Planctomycetaceae bacterium]|nr:Asp-tRNA(Asn)/Glu-tRNA(Gln) amidotransferase subunit GatC [Planctomycetaceae bacterium]
MPESPVPPADAPAPDGALIQKTASLARLALDPSEVEHLVPQFARILGSFETLRALDTTGIEPMTRPIELETVQRADEAGPCLDREAALGLAPKRSDEFYAVPKTLEAEG